MTHFGIICPSAAGHLNPMMALGYELKKRGHHVSVINIFDVRSRVLAAGLEFIAIGRADFPPGASIDLYTRLANLNEFEAIKYIINQWLTNLANAVLRDAPEAIATRGIDALLVDQCSAEGGTLAEYLDIPFISVCSTVMLNQEITVPPFFTLWGYDPTKSGILRNRSGYLMLDRLTTSLAEIISDYRCLWNLPLNNNPIELYSSLAQICQQPAEFEFPRKELPSCFHFTGPLISPMSREPVSFPFERLTGQPLIYVSMGTIQDRDLWIFQAIAQACVVFLNIQLVITLGKGATPESVPGGAYAPDLAERGTGGECLRPGNPIVVADAPGLELLPETALTITDAEMNTVLESLSNGVPMVAIPIANDQPGVAARIAWTRTGEVVPLEKVSVENLRRAIERVLRKEFYKKNALELQQSIKQAGGVSKAADIVEQAVATGQPVLGNSSNQNCLNN